MFRRRKSLEPEELLRHAIDWDSVAELRDAIDRGANPREQRAVEFAIECLAFEVLPVLLEHGASINFETEYGEPAIVRLFFSMVDCEGGGWYANRPIFERVLRLGRVPASMRRSTLEAVGWSRELFEWVNAAFDNVYPGTRDEYGIDESDLSFFEDQDDDSGPEVEPDEVSGPLVVLVGLIASGAIVLVYLLYAPR